MKIALNIALAIMDVFLLLVIIAYPGESGGAEAEGTAANITSETATSREDIRDKSEKSSSELRAELFMGGYEETEDAENTGDVVWAEETAATGEAVSSDDEAVAAGTPDTDEYGYLIPSALADDLSTKDKSTIDDFDWFMNLVMESGMPDDAEFITDPRDVLGDWKCMVIVDPSNAEGKRSYHFCNIHIDCLIKDGIYTMSPHIEWDYEMDISGKEIDESSKDWYLGIGEWTEGWIGNTAAAHNTKLRFYSTGDGKQYAYGGITLQGVKGTGICLVR